MSNEVTWNNHACSLVVWLSKNFWGACICTHSAMLHHTLYHSTQATNCNRLEDEVVKWRSPCVWPWLISYNVVFYVMPCSPRTLCSLQRVINTLNQTVIMAPMGICVSLSLSVCHTGLLCVHHMGLLCHFAWYSHMFLCVWLSECTDISLGNTIIGLVIRLHRAYQITASLRLFCYLIWHFMTVSVIIRYKIKIFRKMSFSIWHSLRPFISSLVCLSLSPLLQATWPFYSKWKGSA